MRSRIRAALASPRFLLALTAAFLSLVVQSGELGSADTMHRLQTAHSFWTSEPPIFPNEYPEFGVYGRGGKLYDWYGIGQPLLLLPFDIVGTYIEKLPAFAAYKGNDPTVRNIFVSGAVNTLLSILTALVCFQFLLALEFNTRETVAGVLAFLLCTTHLHYTQNMMENNYIFLLTLTGLLFQYQWLRRGRTRHLLIGSAALGLNLLTRLTTALDIMAVGLFLLLVVWSSEGKQAIWRRLACYGKTAFPVYFVFFFIDRLYQFHRFGTWTDTYVRYFALKYHSLDSTLPPNYPWETPFHVGFFGALFSREKSVFLFDPLIVLTIAIAVFFWKRLTPQVKAYIVMTFSLVLAYICLYARYTVWNGNFAWGDRYVSSAAQMAAFISVPMLLKFRVYQTEGAPPRGPRNARFWRSGVTRFAIFKGWGFRLHLGKLFWNFGKFVVLASLLIQISSLMFWLPLEIYQADDFGHPQWIIWLRLKNILAFALGKTAAWGLVTDSMGYDQWDFQHITTWNFLPFVLRRIGEAPAWMIDAAFLLWAVELVLLAITLRKLSRIFILTPEA
jgi:hypothetical protein